MDNRPRTPSAIIIGAGPAGSVAAVCLGRAGWNVSLIEQQAFPRDKVCGECLSALGAAVLGRLGLRSEVLADAMPLPRSILHAGGRSVTLDLPAACWGLSRRRMDARLLDAARAAGAMIHQPARVEGIEADRGTGGVGRGVCRVRDLVTNRIDQQWADYILLADGKSGLLDGRPAPSGDLGVKAHFEQVAGPRDAVELFALDGHYVGLNPIEAGRWNLAMSVPAGRVKVCGGDFDRLLKRMMGQNAGLRRRLAPARRAGDWIASPLPRFAVNPQRWPDGIIPLGNAAAALEPIGGEGMGLAMRSSEITAAALITAARRDQRLRFASLARDFGQLWRTRILACRAGARVLSTDTLAWAALELLDASPIARNLTLRLIGKGSRA